MRYNELNEIRSIKIQGLEDNTINMTEKDTNNSKILINDSELLRIIKFLSKPNTNGGYPYVSELISLKINKSIKQYKKVRDNHGIIKINNCEWKNVGTVDIPKWDRKVTDSVNYKRLITASGHTRSKKTMLIQEDLYDKINEILLCGLPANTKYEKISKWNSYYGLVSTDSKVVSMPNIVVIDDFKNLIKDKFDVVKQITDSNGLKHYSVEPNVVKKFKILPFDGAGLVSVERAKIWRDELNASIPDDKPKLDYIPSAFQFRAIPCVKGNVYTFDIKEFAKQFGVDEIIDVKGIPHSIANESIDCILTKSQFKFLDLYDSNDPIKDWKEKFNTPCHGYKRTFNISEYSDKYEELKDTMLTAYQQLQTLNFTDNEIKTLCKPTINRTERISVDIDEFLKFRSLIDDNEDDETIDWSIVPPYYKALKYNKSLFGDQYIQEKVKQDIQNFKNRALSGKLFTRGNYQVLTPDVYALAQYAFGIKPTGLLAANQIYSNYWNNQTDGKTKIKEVAIVRNPHIAHEWRIGHLTNTEDMTKWYKYQNTGIITSIYDTILLALNSADTDGDHIGTIYDKCILAAIKRVKKAGNANTIDFEQDSICDNKIKKKNIYTQVNDIKALINVDILGMSNDIGQVVNRVSELWQLEQTEQVQNYIKIMSIIASLTIDYAKTGEKADIPKEIIAYLKLEKVKKPYFMRYLPNQKKNKSKEEEAKNNVKEFGLSDELFIKQERFSRTNCNVNRICWYLEEKFSGIEMKKPKNTFNFTTLLSDKVDEYGDLYKNVKQKLLELQDMFSEYTKEYKIEAVNNKEQKKEYSGHYRSFYQYARYELLSTCKLSNIKVNKVLDILLHLYYTDKEFINKDRSILWNAFEKEIISRCKNEDVSTSFDAKEILQRKVKAEERVKKSSKKLSKKNTVKLKLFDGNNAEIIVTDTDRKQIMKLIKDSQDVNGKVVNIKNVIDARRLYMFMIIVSRKSEQEVERNVSLKDESGKVVKDENGKKVTEVRKETKKNPIQINSNKKYDINYSNIEKITGIDRRNIKNIIKELKELGLIYIYENNLSNPKIKIMFDNHDGEIVYKGNDVIEACELVKSFR